MNRSEKAEVRAEGQVTQETIHYRELTDELQGVIGDFEGRLNHVLSGADSTKPTTKDCDQKELVGLAEQLRTNNTLLYKSIQTLRHMIEQLEV